MKEIMKHGYSGDKWIANPKTHTYTIASGYKWLHQAASKVPWRVWNRLNLPKHNFICWLIMWKRLRVKCKLKQYGISTDDLCCPLCAAAPETVNHLFFECTYAVQCCSRVQQLVGFQIETSSLEACNESLGKISGRFKKRVAQSFYAGLLYTIWRQRKIALWELQVHTPEKAMNHMFQEVYHRIMYVMPKKVNPSHRAWFASLVGQYWYYLTLWYA